MRPFVTLIYLVALQGTEGKLGGLLALLIDCLACAAGDGGQADNCTNGFMSVERMNRVVENYIAASPWNEQIIAPGATFNCSGHIRTLMFGAFWRGQSRTQHPEFQIWRMKSTNVYELVSTAIYTIDQSSGVFYQYSPEENSTLHFEDGDIFGFYQPDDENSRLRLMLAIRTPQPVQTVFNRNDNPNSVFNVNSADRLRRNVMVSIVTGEILSNLLLFVMIRNSFTDPPDCAGNGFMSEETLRSLLGLEGVGRLVDRGQRQQITPDINFTCDGIITKWIIGALRANNPTLVPGPELQLWRNTGNDTYVKINGTHISSEAYKSSLIYEYSNFHPIQFKAGDVLGIFVPHAGSSTLRLRSEVGYGPWNYYITTNKTALTSPYEEISLPDFSRSIYHHLVSLEICKLTDFIVTHFISTHCLAVVSSSTQTMVSSTQTIVSSLPQTMVSSTQGYGEHIVIHHHLLPSPQCYSQTRPLCHLHPPMV